MLVKVSYRKRKNPLKYVYTQRVNVTESLFNNLVDIVQKAIEEGKTDPKLTPLDKMRYGLNEVTVTTEHLRLIKDELEAHSLRPVLLDKPTALYIRETL